MSKCLNCEASLEGNYCSACGQRAKVRPLIMGEIIQEIPSAIFSFESRYWNTIRDFFRNPYKMVKDYSAGKRKYYAPPIQFFFFFATIDLFASYFFEASIDPSSASNDMLESDSMALSTVQRFKMATTYLGYLGDNYSNYFELCIAPFLGLSTRLFYFKRLNLAESLVFAFFSLGISMELFSLVVSPFSSLVIGQIIQLGSLLVAMCYFHAWLSENKTFGILKGILNMTTAFALFLLCAILVLFILFPFLPSIPVEG